MIKEAWLPMSAELTPWDLRGVDTLFNERITQSSFQAGYPSPKGDVRVKSQEEVEMIRHDDIATD